MFILIAILGFMAHTTKAQYNMTPPIPQNYNSQMYSQDQNYPSNSQIYSNCWSTGTCRQTYLQNSNQGYNYNRRYMPASGSFYSSTGHGFRIVRTINDALQTAGIMYLVISDLSDHTKSESTVKTTRITRIVTINNQQVIQEGYRIDGQDYF